MRIDRKRLMATTTTVLVLFYSLSSVSSAQVIGSRDEVNLSMTPTEKFNTKQVYSIRPSQFLRHIETQLTGNGIVVAASSDAVQLVVDVVSYDSGPYLGFSKTARLEVGYRLTKPGISVPMTWEDRCEAKASVDLQDAPDRNKTAVGLCLAALGGRLAERLVGPTATVTVQ